MDSLEVLSRLKSALSLKTDRSLAEYLGVTPSVISTWKSRRIGDWELIIEKCYDSVDFNYIIRGEFSQIENKVAELSILRKRVLQLEEQNGELLGIIKNLSAK